MCLSSERLHQCQGLPGPPLRVQWQEPGESSPDWISAQPSDGQQPQTGPEGHHLAQRQEPHAAGEENTTMAATQGQTMMNHLVVVLKSHRLIRA